MQWFCIAHAGFLPKNGQNSMSRNFFYSFHFLGEFLQPRPCEVPGTSFRTAPNGLEAAIFDNCAGEYQWRRPMPQVRDATPQWNDKQLAARLRRAKALCQSW